MAALPASLQAGTPIDERGNSPFSDTYDTSTRYSGLQYGDRETSPDDRRSSTVSIGSIRTTRHYSYGDGDTLLNEHTVSPSREVPDTPHLPLFPEHDGQNPFTLHSSAPPKPARKQSLLSKIGSIRSSRRESRYGSVSADEQDYTFARGARHRRLASVDEEVDGAGYGIDLSTLESPFEMRPANAKKGHYARVGSREMAPEDLAGVLGDGLDNVQTRTVVPARDNYSVTDATTREFAQSQADKHGEILAVQERHASVSSDITALSGGFNARRAMVMSTSGAPGKTSYFFPDDPDKPCWRPFSMHWAYLGLLVVIALVLAGIQEYLCQESMRRKSQDDGLLRFQKPQDLTIMEYFAWKYLPTIVLVTYGVLWMPVDFEVKRLEPYYQLSRKSGATARDSLNLDYITFLSYLVPLKALRSKQFAVVLSSFATLLAGALTPVLQSASVVMEPKPELRKDGEPKYVRIDPRWSRSVTAVLLLVAVQGILLMIQLWRRKSGLQSDPKGIAGIASMATKSHILNDFKGLDVAPNHAIHERLRTRRYNLHKSSLWQGEYLKKSEQDENIREEHPHPTILRLHAGIPFIIYIFLIGAVLPVFMFVKHANAATAKLPWLLTLLATTIKLMWGCLDMNLRVIEPYYILSRGNAPPSTLLLDYTGTVPGYLTAKAAMNGQYLTALVGWGSILTEVLTVCVTSFSVDGHKFISGKGGSDSDGKDNTDRYNTDQTFRSFWVSFALAYSIFAYLIALAIVVYVKRHHRFLPRQPGTIAGVLAFIHQSRMLLDFVDTEHMDEKRMRAHLDGLGKRYGLGWFVGRDGEDHCGVDQEPLRAKYKFGVDWTATHVSGTQIGMWEHY